jgi:hypothetical protein
MRVSGPAVALARRRRRRLSALTLSERAVAASLHPHTGQVHPFVTPPEVRHVASSQSTEPKGSAAS